MFSNYLKAQTEESSQDFYRQKALKYRRKYLELVGGMSAGSKRRNDADQKEEHADQIVPKRQKSNLIFRWNEKPETWKGSWSWENITPVLTDDDFKNLIHLPSQRIIEKCTELTSYDDNLFSKFKKVCKKIIDAKEFENLKREQSEELIREEKITVTYDFNPKGLNDFYVEIEGAFKGAFKGAFLCESLDDYKKQFLNKALEVGGFFSYDDYNGYEDKINTRQILSISYDPGIIILNIKKNFIHNFAKQFLQQLEGQQLEGQQLEGQQNEFYVDEVSFIENEEEKSNFFFEKYMPKPCIEGDKCIFKVYIDVTDVTEVRLVELFQHIFPNGILDNNYPSTFTYTFGTNDTNE